jgi:large subunit ribosomal protein L21
LYAVIRTGGKQYRVQEGREVRVGKLPGAPGDTIELGDVLLMGDGDAVTVGAPTIEGARVLGTIAEQARDRKVVVFRYKAKTRSRKKTGHRQHFTRVVIDDILAPGQEPKPKQAPVEEETREEAPVKGRRRRRAGAGAAAAADAAAVTPTSADDVAGEATEDAVGDAAESASPVATAAESTTEETAAEDPKKRRSRRKTE